LKKKIKVTKKSVKKAPKSKGPVYICQTCGLRLVVTKEGAGMTNLVCCDQVMDRK